MAESVDPKIKNRAFLDYLERQRLNKPSSLTIDLRNKVAGECQPYLFGGVTHYLDDRGYLLAKRLLERFDGRYTIGVYELLFKALKTLAKAPSLPPVQTTQAILSRDNKQVQLLAMGKPLQRNELRVLYTTTIDIHYDDILYHATTIDISYLAVRAVMKRAFTLQKGETVLISFSELTPEADPLLLIKVPHEIIKIEHDDFRTHLILNRIETESSNLTQWWKGWAQTHQSLAHVDIEHELHNIAHDFYLRLYLQNTKKPLIWLSQLEQDAPIKIVNLNPYSHRVTAPLCNKQGELDLSLIPLRQLVENPLSSYLVFITNQDGINHSHVVACDKVANIAPTFAQKFQHVLLLESHKITLDMNAWADSFAPLFDIDNIHAQTLYQRLNTLHHLISLTDISQSCRHFPLNINRNDSTTPDYKSLDENLNHMPKPTTLHHHIKRQDKRFLIHTDVSLFLMDEHLTISTKDVSEMGLSLELPGHFPLSVGTSVRVNFIRWQNKTKKIKLNDVPFIVRRVQYWNGTTSLGLERNMMACGDKLNQFFADIIEDNREQLASDHQDQFVSQESKILGLAFANVMTNIPFFLGINDDKKRAIQSVANTEHNQAAHLSSLWPHLSELAADMSEWLKVTIDNKQPITDFGIYCYRDKSQQWHINTDHHFKTTQHKALFINRALLAEHQQFFHCDLTAIKSPIIEREADLGQYLSRLRSHSPHNVKQIKDITRSLFALGDLTDITTIITAIYGTGR